LTPESWIGDDRDSQGIRDHWSRLVAVADDPTEWGTPPSDLAERLADIAIAGPGAASLRSLTRLRERFDLTDASLREAAASVAWAFTSFFHAPEAQQIVATSGSADLDFWQKLLEHCAEGGFGSVLDEWFHLVPDQCKLNRSSERPLDAIVAVAAGVLRLEDGRSFSDFYDRLNSSLEPRRRELRTHFAMRYGQARGSTAEGENPLDVRNAFNSPFRPFVLISTSVGQEGLDFHHYAHAIVHWNLPGNPVDLEQREGRVHRYKNHAVRKNIAAKFMDSRELLSGVDPWTRLFELADDGLGTMRPHWVFDGDAQIQRLVPTLPFSREVGKLHQLVEATTLYRMTIGQPRQAELIEVLAGLDADEQEAIRSAVTINLAPPPGP
jgi:hypothetical protein